MVWRKRIAAYLVGALLISSIPLSFGAGGSSIAPSTPTNFRVWGGMDTVQIHWSEPTDAGTPEVTNYIIYRGPEPSRLNFLVSLDSTTFDYEDKKVNQASTYYYSIAATNGATSSPQTVPHVVTTRYYGMNESWSRSTIDSYQSAGWWSSMEVDSLGYVHVAYENYWDGSYRYADNVGGYWKIETLEGENSFAGDRSSLTIDKDNTVHLAYNLLTSVTPTVHRLVHAWNAGGTWQKEYLDTGGESPSIAADKDGNLFIAYYSDEDNTVKMTSKQGGAWTDRTIEYLPSSISVGTRIAIDSLDGIHIVYGDLSGGALMYAQVKNGSISTSTIETGSGWLDKFDLAVNTTGIPYVVFQKDESIYLATILKGTWQRYLVQPMTEATSDGPISSQPSIAITQRNTVCISYADLRDFHLKFAFFYLGFISSNYWVDGNPEVGSDSCIAVDSSGVLHVTYLDYSNKDLKYAKARLGAPTEVTSFTATEGNSKVVLSFKPPSENGGTTVPYYYIFRGESADTDKMEYLGHTQYDEFTYTDSNVTNNQTYFYMIRSEGAFGRGMNSTVVKATPSEMAGQVGIGTQIGELGVIAIVCLVPVLVVVPIVYLVVKRKNKPPTGPSRPPGPPDSPLT